MTYYMTVKSTGSTGWWNRCNAKTLSGAKREATMKCGGGYVDDVVCVGAPLNDNATYVDVIAEKRVGKWRNV